MYKIVHESIVIDILKEVKYMRFLQKAKIAVMTDRPSANCILASDNKEKYHVQGMPYPEGSGYKTVSLVEISESEYENLSHLIESGDTVCGDESILNDIREKKIEEMSKICNQTIVNGVTVTFSDNKKHHFRLTIEDQINLISLKSLIESGSKEVVYHETDSLCKSYKAKDILLLIKTADEHKIYHTTYFNKLKHYIKSLYDIEKINSIEYGIII